MRQKTREVILEGTHQKSKPFTLKHFIPAVLSLALGSAAVAAPDLEAPNKQAEYLAKAQMIKTLVDMITWPESLQAQKEFNICIQKDFPYAAAVQTINAQSAANHVLRVKSIDDPLTTKEDCQLIYLYDLPEKTLAKIVRAYKSKPVVLLGDMDRFALHGGSMNFTQLNEVLAITVNTDAMKAADLPIDLKAVEQITVIPQVDDLKAM